MDPKASAKSKRSHTLHGRRSHQHPPAASTSHNPKTKPNTNDPHKQRPEAHRPRSHRPPDLPSNWDRYSDNDEDGGDRQTPTASASPLPKSKGADFAYLLDLSRSQPRDAFRSAPTFDDTLSDFVKGLNPFVSSGAKSVLRSREDDDFVVDDEVTSSFQVPFAVDFNAIASRIERLKLSQRLFIDGKYLDEEMDTEQLATENFHDKSPAHVESNSGSASLKHPSQEEKLGKDDSNTAKATVEDFGSVKVVGRGISKTHSIDKEKKSTSIHKSLQHDSDVNRSQIFTSTSSSQSSSAPLSDKYSRFESSTAEAELDTLLDSISAIKIPDSSTTENSSYGPYDHAKGLGGYTSSASIGLFPLRQDVGTSSLAVSSTSLVSETELTGFSASRNNFRRDNTSAWHARDNTSFLDDTIDDLLMQTSLPKSDKPSSSSAEKKAATRAPNISQALDDLDSLLDGL